MNRYITDIWKHIIDFIFPPRKDEIYTHSVDVESIVTLPSAPYIDERTHALFSYKDERVRSLIWELKYHKNKRVCTAVAPLLADLITGEVHERELFSKWHTVFLVPVPITNKKRRQRGYSQLEFLSSYLIPLLDQSITYDPTLLEKTKETVSQNKTTSRHERLTNLVGTMRATRNLALTQIVLLDDVTTTGATLAECRRALEEAGVKKENIIAFTLAH